MSRRLSAYAMSALMATVIVGCSVQRPPETSTQPQPVVTQPGANQPALNQPGASQPGDAPAPKQQGPDATHWVLPSQGSRQFLGQKVVVFNDGSGTLRALDSSGANLWSVAVKDDAVRLVVRSDAARAVALSSSGSVQVDLTSGAMLGPGPFTQAAMGQYVWHGDWLLSGVTMYKAPVDPKSPGKSEDHVEWNLYHQKGNVWEKIGPLVERGGITADLSADGSVALISAKGQASATVFVEGRHTQTITAAQTDAWFGLTASGKNVLVLDGSDLVVYTVGGKETARKPVGADKQLTVWGERAVVADHNSFSVYDVAGRELFHQTGSVSRQRPNGKYLLAAIGGTSALVDETGKIVVTYPHDLESMGISPDGKWVYGLTDTGLDAYAVPD